MKALFSEIGDYSVLTPHGQKLWGGKKECNMHHCKESFRIDELDGWSENVLDEPNDAFILGSVRNPFEFYVSWWLMELRWATKGCSRNDNKMRNPWECATGVWDPYNSKRCVGREAQKLNITDVYLPEQSQNVATFERWLQLVLDSPCDSSMSAVFKKHMVDESGRDRFVAVVRTEQLYPTLFNALTMLEGTMGTGIVDWEGFRQAEAAQFQANSQSQAEKGGHIKQEKLPYSCYYQNPAIKDLVLRNDQEYLDRWNYSFEDMPACTLEGEN